MQFDILGVLKTTVFIIACWRASLKNMYVTILACVNILKVIEPTSEPVPLNSTAYASAGKLLEVDIVSNNSDSQNEFQLQYRAGILYTKLLTFRANYFCTITWNINLDFHRPAVSL